MTEGLSPDRVRDAIKQVLRESGQPFDPRPTFAIVIPPCLREQGVETETDYWKWVIERYKEVRP
jgi:hypothetical protein